MVDHSAPTLAVNQGKRKFHPTYYSCALFFLLKLHSCVFVVSWIEILFAFVFSFLSRRTIGWFLYTGIQRVQTQQISIADQILHSKYIQQQETETLESCCSRTRIVQRLHFLFFIYSFPRSFVLKASCKRSFRFFCIHASQSSFNRDVLVFWFEQVEMEATCRNVP